MRPRGPAAWRGGTGNWHACQHDRYRNPVDFDGHAITAAPGASLLQAWIAVGLPLTENVGGMGQGVCGACRVLVRREGQRIAETALACETRVEAGMKVAFIEHFPARRAHAYDLAHRTPC